jgi:non-ribosomal peptide synthetase component E (peptide arylation enzyme)
MGRNGWDFTQLSASGSTGRRATGPTTRSTRCSSGIGVATFKRPERLELRDELPRSPVGKILKRELREELRRPAG